MSVVLKSVSILGGKPTDLTIDQGLITSIEPTSQNGLDCAGLVLLPGFVDLHTHLREPGFEESETVLTGSQSGAAGGYTTLFAMANTSPVTDNAEIAEQVHDLGVAANLLRVQVIGAVTKGLAGKELSQISKMAKSRAQVRVFSDDGHCVWDAELMEQALLEAKQHGGVIAQHAQAPELTIDSQMNDSALAVELGLKGWPAVAEESIIERDALLAEKVGARLHICHLTTAGAVEVVRWAKKRGIAITAEVTPHHLLLTEDLVRSYDPVFKVNPPLRRREDTLALQAALLDGTIDIIATDHAPHSSEKKDCEWQNAAFGMVGLENAASVAQQVILESGGSWQDLVKVMSSRPAEIGGHAAGVVAVGEKANLVLVDPASKRWISSNGHSKSQNNPFAGIELPGRVVHTIFEGRFTLQEGELVHG